MSGIWEKIKERLGFGKRAEGDKEDDRVMYIIAGLGNPTREYEKTRHNVGFEVIDVLADRLGTTVEEKKFKGCYGRGTCQLLSCGIEQVEAALDALAEHHAVVIQRIANVEAVYLRRLCTLLIWPRRGNCWLTAELMLFPESSGRKNWRPNTIFCTQTAF